MTDNTLYLFSADTIRTQHDLQSAIVSEPLHSVMMGQYVEKVEVHNGLEYKELQHAALYPDMIWLFALSALVACLVGLVRTISPSFIGQMLSLLFSDFHWRSVVDSLTLQNRVVSRILRYSFYVVLAILLYEIYHATGHSTMMGFSGIELYGLFFATVFIYFVVKYILIYIISFVFDIPEEMKYIIICKKLSSNIISVILFPVAMIFPFVPANTYILLVVIAVAIVGLVYLWRILKSLKIILTDYLSIFYSFLYLCTVEAIPMAFVCKLTYIAMGLESFSITY